MGYVSGMKGVTPMEIKLIDRIRGSLYGFAIGDAMGATTEFMTAEEIKSRYGVLREIIGGGWLKLPVGSVTDDTEMTLCVYEAMKKAYPDIPNTLRECCKQFRAWADKGPRDIGSCCQESIYRVPDSIIPGEWMKANVEAQNKGAIAPLGNGGLMRCLIPCLTGSLELAYMQTYLTHTHPEQYIYTERYFMAMQDCLTGVSPIKALGFKQDPSGHVRDTCMNAMYWVRLTDTFEDAIIGAVNDGGDADTIAALTGGLAGAYYGFYAIPERWIDSLDISIRSKLETVANNVLYWRG